MYECACVSWKQHQHTSVGAEKLQTSCARVVPHISAAGAAQECERVLLSGDMLDWQSPAARQADARRGGHEG